VRIIHSGLVARFDEALDELQALGELLRLQFAGGFRAGPRAAVQLLFSRLIDISNVADGFGADASAVKLSSPYSSCALMYSSSVSSWCCLSGVRPGSMTM
jgi:hypothetical protein